MNQNASENTLSEDVFLRSMLKQTPPSPEPIDEGCLLTLANLHGVIPQLYKDSLRSRFPEETTQKTLQQNYHKILQANLLLTAHLMTITKALQGKNFNYIVIKGPALAQELYNDISMGQFSDIDLFIDEADISAIATHLLTLDFKPVLPMSLLTRKKFLELDNDFSFRHKKTNALIELHWKLFPKRHKMPLDFVALHSRTTILPLQNSTVSILSPEDNLLYLSLHGAKHIFERYEWVYDLHSLLHKYPHIDLKQLYLQAKKEQIEVPFLLGIFLSQTLFETSIPKEFENYKTIQIEHLIGIVLDYYNKGFVHWDESDKKRARFLFLSELFQEKEPKAVWFFKSLFKTTPVDIITFNLPDELTFLYPLLRPFRLLYKHFFTKKPQYA